MSFVVHTPRMDSGPLFDGISRLAASFQFTRRSDAQTRAAVSPPTAGFSEAIHDAWGVISQDWEKVTQDWVAIIQDWGKVIQDAGAAREALIQEMTHATAPEEGL